jgi:hypothetical protein
MHRKIRLGGLCRPQSILIAAFFVPPYDFSLSRLPLANFAKVTTLSQRKSKYKEVAQYHLSFQFLSLCVLL